MFQFSYSTYKAHNGERLSFVAPCLGEAPGGIEVNEPL